MFDIDAVVTFVNGNDNVWREKFNAELERERLNNSLPSIPYSHSACRFIESGELQLCLTGIQRFLPFVRNIFLVVSNMEQVPDYAKGIGKLKVVLHEDIIPERFLPTFNSSAIELFLHRIPGLSDHFIYFNDDVIALKPMTPDIWFNTETGIPNNQFIMSKMKYPVPAHIYSFKNALELAESVSNFHNYPKSPRKYFSVQHCSKAIQKSTCEELWSKAGERLEESITPFRSEKSINGYVFQYYDLFTNRCNNVVRTGSKHITRKNASVLDFMPMNEVCVNMPDGDAKSNYLGFIRNFLRYTSDKTPVSV